MKDIFAKRLKNARIMHGLSMEKLAENAGISKQMISKYEKALSMPDSSVLIKLARTLNQKADYFFTPFKIELGPIEFRKKSTLLKSKQKSIKEKIQLKMEHYLELEDILSINYEFENPLSKTSVNNAEEVEKAAEELRDKWDLGSDPIYSVISLLEEQEVKIIEIEENINDFDGLSSLIKEKFPVIVVNKNFPTERKRFTLLHELAHLLLKFPENAEKEKLCHRFAGAMLLPHDEVIEQFGNFRRNLSVNELTAVQRHFGISTSALIHRLYQAGVINQQKQRQFFIRMNQNQDFKANLEEERYQGEEFSDRFEKLIYRALAQEQISISKAAAMLGKSVQQIRDNFAMI